MRAQYTASKSSGLAAAYFSRIFHLPYTNLWMDPAPLWIQNHFHDQPMCFGNRLSTLLAFQSEAFVRRVLWKHVRRGAGLSTLETAADPFLSICDPPRYSEMHLNLAQAVQGVGSFVAPLLASRVFFAHIVDNA